MRLITILIYVFLLQNNSFAQQLCVPVDSIKVYSLPRYLKTNIALDDFAVREWKDNSVNKFTKIITDDALILKFTEINLVKEDKICNNVFDIDVRCVIDVFLGAEIITISLSYTSNHLGKYKYLGRYYYPITELKEWLENIGIIN